MANFTLDQTGQEIQDILDTVGNNQATSGQVLTADGNGGASWQNASGGNAVTLGTETQTLEGSKVLNVTDGNLGNNLSIRYYGRRINLRPHYNGYASVEFGNSASAISRIYKEDNNDNVNIKLPSTSGTLALTSDIDAKVPDVPNTDGTYVLKCVVSNGGTTKTYQWVLDN